MRRGSTRGSVLMSTGPRHGRARPADGAGAQRSRLRRSRRGALGALVGCVAVVAPAQASATVVRLDRPFAEGGQRVDTSVLTHLGEDGTQFDDLVRLPDGRLVVTGGVRYSIGGR
jgi:hypothetical protein